MCICAPLNLKIGAYTYYPDSTVYEKHTYKHNIGDDEIKKCLFSFFFILISQIIILDKANTFI